ncbi:hypothetical protein PHMEG_0003427 [Phytophthora megakarya]|uniref:Bzip transcription factor n=1 Tax=Phytophthora megakarya TaxID=4795 RepID=A0A225WY28_9STRA|nr:hypothetical protein PHMEG_0003427 [Phytophthora megakarya]
MSTDVVFNADQGIDSMMKHWQMVSILFKNVEMELKGMTKGTDNSLVAASVTSFTITEQTLSKVFPHLNSKEGEAKAADGSSLKDKLRGQRIEMTGSTRFYWDTQSGCVTNVRTSSDFLEPMLRLLGNLEDVSHVLESSTISLNFCWMSTSHAAVGDGLTTQDGFNMDIPHQFRLPETIHDFDGKQNGDKCSVFSVIEKHQPVQPEKPKSMNFRGMVMRRIALEYLSRFRNGLPCVAELQSSQNFAELEFLKRTMLPDVVFNAERGVKAIVSNWKRLSLSFYDIEVELDNLVEGLGGSLIATTTTSVTITQQTLENVFPHLCVDDIDSDPLAQKLLNKRLVVIGSTRFDWDDKSSRVKSITSQSDMLTPILRLLGDLENTSRVFENAMISPEFQWRLPA